MNHQVFLLLFGTTPHTRGKATRIPETLAQEGNNPAHAGNTSVAYFRLSGITDQPRTRGEYT